MPYFATTAASSTSSMSAIPRAVSMSTGRRARVASVPITSSAS
jgi:hypothetical protein